MKQLRATVTGKVANRPVTLTLSQNLPQSQPDHFFLNMMLDQWRAAPHKEAPAILQSDRALAIAAHPFDAFGLTPLHFQHVGHRMLAPTVERL